MQYPLQGDYRISQGWNAYSIMYPFWGFRHKGIDWAAPAGTKIRAVENGKITEAGNYGGWGKKIKIKHEGGFESLYAHMSRLHAIHGNNVHKGQLIGEVGSTGISTGNHLHLSILKNGAYVDPLKYIRKESASSADKLINNNNNDMDYNEAKSKLLKDNEFLLEMFNTLQSNGFIKRDQRIATDANNILRRGRGSKWLIDKARRYLLGKKLSDYEFILDKFSRPLRREEADYKEVKDKKEIL